MKFINLWKHGASVLIFLGFVLVLAFGMSALVGAVVVSLIELVWNPVAESNWRLSVVLAALLIIPATVGLAMEHVPGRDG